MKQKYKKNVFCFVLFSVEIQYSNHKISYTQREIVWLESWVFKYLPQHSRVPQCSTRSRHYT